ncbi:MAG: dTDP-4-amino-4,6-dideoxygalactose transaminase [Clostridia bacterium]|nr:dTDP-4-amino-4,6-dideoxygalactose transaminase [Clostridia bacterium]
MIHFNIAPYTGDELEYIKQAVDNHKICGDGKFTEKCSQWFKSSFKLNNAYLTTSCTHALEIAALLCNINPGDEVIMPSYTFVSTADAFVRLGAKIVFVDVRPDTMNINEKLIEPAITKKTKVIVPVHYAGVSCEMETINKIAKKYNLMVVEDAAQGVMSTYRSKPLGTLGHFGCYSFHETKNYSMGEGGAIVFNDMRYRDSVEIIREKGTDRSKFFRGQIDKYTWVDYGSSYLPSDINAAYLWPQLLIADKINKNRLDTWNFYYKTLKPLQDEGRIHLPVVPRYCTHNAHMFYIKTKDLSERTALINYLKKYDIQAVFHYVPLHSSPAGKKFGRFFDEDIFTTKESDRLLRLPMYYNISNNDREFVVQKILDFYK